MAELPVRESIRQVDDNSWLIGGRLLLTRAQPPESEWGYQVTDASLPAPETRALSPTGEIQLIHDVADASAVFTIGQEALCKVKRVRLPRATREHATLSWLRQREWSFAIPRILHHVEFDGRYYLILERVPGRTLDSVWPTLGEVQRQLLVERMVEICAELAVPAPGSKITGVDGCFLPEQYLCGRDLDCSPENLRKTCLELGMDCSALVFYHCDLGPSNILVDLQTSKIGIVDWEAAGFVPREWIATKFIVSGGLDLSTGDAIDWRKRVMIRMGQLGYLDVADAFSDQRL